MYFLFRLFAWHFWIVEKTSDNLYVLFSNVYLNLPPMSPMKQLVRKHQDMLLWYCNLFDIALKCYRNRGVFQVSQYFRLSVLWEYYIWCILVTSSIYKLYPSITKWPCVKLGRLDWTVLKAEQWFWVFIHCFSICSLGLY